MEKFSLGYSSITVLYVVLIFFSSRILALSFNILPMADRTGSGQALPTYEEIRLLILRFQLKKTNNDLSYDLYIFYISGIKGVISWKEVFFDDWTTKIRYL